MADRKISDLTALTTPASGDYLPIVDISEAAAASKNKRITIEELMRGVPDGTAAAPGIAFASDPNTGIYSPGADQLAVATNGTGRLFVDASGNVGIGAASFGYGEKLGVGGTIIASDGTVVGRITSAAGTAFWGTTTNHSLAFQTNGAERLRITSAGLVGIGTSSPAQRLTVFNPSLGVPATSGTTQTNGAVRIGATGTSGVLDFGIGAAGTNQWIQSTDSNNLSLGYVLLLNPNGGNVGIGTTLVGNSANQLSVRRDSANNIVDALLLNNGSIDNAAGTGVRINFSGVQESNSDIRYAYIESATSSINNDHYIAFGTNAAGVTPVERARLTSSGQLLVGTSTARGNFLNSTSAPRVQIEGTSTDGGSLALITSFSSATNGAAPILQLGRAGSTAIGSDTIVANNNYLGQIIFSGNDGSEFVSAASIDCQVDGTPSANDLPGRLVFSTTAAGDASPTEAMRINNEGIVLVRTTAAVGSTNRFQVSDGFGVSAPNGLSFNTTNAANVYVGSMSNGRSINATGTINASGADYAEYMVKCGDFSIAKGDVCGLTKEGLLTNVFADAIGFMVKSTNPSYVGNDTWVTPETIKDLAEPELEVERLRQQVDRIAFAGQVPVNVTGAAPGQYIVPIAAADGGITGIAKDEADLTFAEYMQAVGKVIAIENDGRARIIVKVA
jgi:hypothetical protein